jgi:hypothetical protein
MYEVVRKTTRQTCNWNFVGRRKHEDTELRVIRKTVYRRKHEIPCGMEFRVFPKNTKFRVSVGRRRRHENTEICVTQRAVWRLKNAEIPNSRNPTTCSKISGTQPELTTSESLNIRKDGEDQRPMQNRILEQVSNAQRRTSGPTRRVRNDDNAGRDPSRKPEEPQVELEGEC